jgi:hypothetical protein
MTGIEGLEVAPLTEADRWALLAIWGLDRFDFEYREKAGPLVLRGWKVEGTRCEPLFPESTGDVSESGDRPTLVRTHLANQLAEGPLFAPVRLAEELLPFPHRLWMAAGTAEASGGIESSEKAWLATGLEWRALLDRLQERLFQAEISLLTWTRNGGPSLTLFAHCVRRRFLGLGRWEEGSDKRDELARLAASFQNLTVEIPGLAADWESHTALVKRAVEAALAGNPHAPQEFGASSDAPRPLPL